LKRIKVCVLLHARLPFSPSRLGLASSNSRARRQRSAVRPLAGFGFPHGLPASPFDIAKQSDPDPPKKQPRLP
jgi:hypothetical protein